MLIVLIVLTRLKLKVKTGTSLVMVVVVGGGGFGGCGTRLLPLTFFKIWLIGATTSIRSDLNWLVRGYLHPIFVQTRESLSQSNVDCEFKENYRPDVVY